LDGVGARWAIRENTLVFYGETFGGICDARVGCFVGPRLPRRYKELLRERKANALENYLTLLFRISKFTVSAFLGWIPLES
jgi:hypothetical protein